MYGDAPSNPPASDHLFTRREDHLQIQTPSVGNVALWNPVEKTLYLAVDASGTFPLYYVEHRDGLLFSSLLNLLRGAIQDGLDDVAVLEFLRDGYVVGDKTVFGAARRLLPGQALRYDSTARVASISEGSQAWAGQAETMAATLIPARAPLFGQEVSRLFRKVYESGRMALHRRTRGAIPLPRLGWVNFDFLRQGALEPIVDGLRSDIWDRDAIRRRIRRLPDEPDPGALHPVFDQMSKVYTVGLLIR